MLADRDIQYVGIYAEQHDVLLVSLQTCRFLLAAGKLVEDAGTSYRLWLHAFQAGPEDWQGPTEPTSATGKATGCLLACKDRDRLFHLCYRRRYSFPPHPTNRQTPSQ